MSIICPVCKIPVDNIHMHMFTSLDKQDHLHYLIAAIEELADDIINYHNFEIIDANVSEDYNDLFTDLFLSNVMIAVKANIRKRVGQQRRVIGDVEVTEDLCTEILRYSIPYSNVVQHYRTNADMIQHYSTTSVCQGCGCDCADDPNFRYIYTDKKLFSNIEILCTACIAVRAHNAKIAITKTFYFAAAHHLPGYDGLCFFTHGHEWKLEVTVKNNIHTKSAMTLDFVDLKKAVTECVIDKLDHNYINDFVYNATAENMCVWIWNELMLRGELKGIENIRLWESPTSYADLNREDMENLLCS